ncbi:agmatine deiminase family protein [Allorhodopirellula heiligendammensis]|uniref:Agmatine deiminase n=1 Tax=Allorhodopirellula heiligendammensis TaxID=2714739 RepID=A0A5C6C5W1_9BACT|nr:agmatine deiminase family protein [Allorhodopirellula heiligendammensis]TWU18169.1 putative agmatine deiminase [Allorhodopirellula heiligendammensis]
MSLPRRFPAQWEPCDAVWLAWPHNLETWPGHFKGIPEAFAAFAVAIAESTPVRILASDSLRESCQRIILPAVSEHPRSGTLRPIEIVEIPTNDCWIRDFGPTFVHEGDGLLAVNWHFNAWGGKYAPHDLDQAAGREIALAAGVRCLHAGLTLEGGALETDGAGRLLVHSACVLDDARNPGLTQQQAAQRFNQYLGVHEIAWIDGGLIPGDDTDGHIDQLARFVDRENIVAAVAADANDPCAAALQANFRQLQLWGRQTSPNVQIHRLPVPPPRTIDGHPVPQSYCNFLRLGADRILVPTFAHPSSDTKAIEILSDLCPGVEIQGVPCEKIAWGLGALHCASCHQPAPPDGNRHV